MSDALSLPATTPVRIEVADCFDFLATLPDGSVDCVVTDPAYSGMNQHMSFGRGRIVGDYSSDENEKWFTEFQDDPETFLRLLNELNRVLHEDRHLYIMFDSFSLLSLGHLVRDVFNVKNLIVWDKVNIGMGHYFRRRHETIVFACKGKRRLSRRDLTDVWAIKRIYKSDYPTQKPVELFAKMLEGSVEPGMTVCDPFCGSGSSALASLRAGCNFVGCDISEKAVALALRRCSEFSFATK
jgi:site-specific DNA-methyltransferase (adenine-specific)